MAESWRLLRVALTCAVLGTSLTAVTGAALAEDKGPIALDFTPLGASHVEKSSTGSAPADALFGRYHMSVLGIDNAIRHFAGYLPLDEGPIGYAVDALRDWENQYPTDPWIPRDLFMLQRVYERAHTAESWGYAKRVGAWLASDYPSADATSLSGMELSCIAHGRCWQPPFVMHP